MAAVVSNAWFAYDRHGRPPSSHLPSNADEGLMELMIECDAGWICVMSVGKRVLLCCITSATQASKLDCDGLGLVKLKMRSFQTLTHALAH